MAADDLYPAWVALRQTALTLERALDARLLPWRLGQSQALVLLVLARHGPQRVSDLSHVLVHSLQTMNGLLDRMERRGLLHRERSHPTNRRAVLVTLTDAGRSLADEVHVPVWSTLAEAFASLSATDLADVTETLRRVCAAGAPLANIPPEHLDYATERLAIAPPGTVIDADGPADSAALL